MLEPLLHEFSFNNMARVNLIATYMVKDGKVIVSGISLEVDLMVVDMTHYDVILEMD